MIRKFFSLQWFLDALFDEGWCSLGLHDGCDDACAVLAELNLV